MNERLEAARREKVIGKSLEAVVEISTPVAELAEVSAGMLEELFIVSKVRVARTEGEQRIEVRKAEGEGMKKCVRCWKYWDVVGTDAGHPELCERCTGVVVGLG